MPTTLLLADESPTIRKIVELTFADTDIRVETASAGGDAVEKWNRLRPDVLLIDIGLRDPDGYELCRRVKTSGRPVPVGLLVSTFERIDDERMQACGADGQLTKPFESTALVDWVHGLRLATGDEAPLAATESADAVADDAHDAASPADDPQEKASHDATPAAGSGLDAPALSDELVDAVARRVIERLSVEVVREIAREIIPEVASTLVRERIRELEQEDS